MEKAQRSCDEAPRTETQPSTTLERALREDWAEAIWEMSPDDPRRDQIGEAILNGQWQRVGAYVMDVVTRYWTEKLTPTRTGSDG